MTSDDPKKDAAPAAAPKWSQELQALFGPPPLLKGEDGAAYWTVYRRIRLDVAPQDVVDEMCVRDIVDLLWESFRLRRLKAKFTDAAAADGLGKLLARLGKHWELARKWALNEAAAVAEVSAVLQQAGLDQEAIIAQTFFDKLAAFDCVERLIAQNEARRVRLMRELDRRRDLFADRLREIAATVEAAELSTIAPPAKAAE